MSNASPRILVTGASGQLGRRVIRQLLERVRPAQIVAAVRNPDAAADLAALGVELRRADYDQPATLAAAFAGIDRLLLISSNAVGRRLPQHRAAIDAVKATGVGRIAYTSILHADRSAIGLAEEHRQTEALLKASGLAVALLRNGWYTENYTAAIPAALAHGALLGSAGDGRLATATRDDYAAAAAAVLAAPDARFAGVYELAGDSAYTRAEFAAELSRQAGKAIAYRNLPEADYKAALAGAGLPEAVASMVAQADAAAAGGALFDDSRTLSRLIGRPTTPLKDAIATALKTPSRPPAAPPRMRGAAALPSRKGDPKATGWPGERPSLAGGASSPSNRCAVAAATADHRTAWPRRGAGMAGAVSLATSTRRPSSRTNRQPAVRTANKTRRPRAGGDDDKGSVSGSKSHSRPPLSRHSVSRFPPPASNHAPSSRRTCIVQNSWTDS